MEIRSATPADAARAAVVDPDQQVLVAVDGHRIVGTVRLAHLTKKRQPRTAETTL